MKKRIAPQTFLRRGKTKTHRRVLLKTEAAIYKITYDPELPRTKTPNNVILSSIAATQYFTHQLKTKKVESWEGCKTSPTTPLVKCLDDGYREKLLIDIRGFANSPSRVVSRYIGLIPRQIGQLRRFNIWGWRNLSNRHI